MNNVTLVAHKEGRELDDGVLFERILPSEYEDAKKISSPIRAMWVVIGDIIDEQALSKVLCSVQTTIDETPIYSSLWMEAKDIQMNLLQEFSQKILKSKLSESDKTFCTFFLWNAC